MTFLREIISGLTFFERRFDDDLIDRVNYFITPNLLIALSILVSFKQFGGKPIECMMQGSESSGYEQYAENYCWAENTYYIPMNQKAIPQDISKRQQAEVAYYQWVPFFLVIEAFCFMFPAFFWGMFSTQSGIKLHNIVKLAIDAEMVKPEVRMDSLRQLQIYLENALKFHRRSVRRHVLPHRILRCLNLPYKACYVTTMYMITKFLFVANLFLQWILLNKFLSTDKYAFYGLGAISDILNGTDWSETGVFPRVTLCDFYERGMGNQLRPVTIQCVLTINLFNEKIFVFLWFWFVCLGILTLISFIYWGFNMFLPYPSKWFISRHMELSDMPFDPSSSEKDVDKFVASYLKKDGVFVLRMIMMHTGVIFGTDLCLCLWKSFYGIENEFQRQLSLEMNTTGASSIKDKEYVEIRRRQPHSSAVYGRIDPQIPAKEEDEEVDYIPQRKASRAYDEFDLVDGGNRLQVNGKGKDPEIGTDNLHYQTAREEAALLKQVTFDEERDIPGPPGSPKHNFRSSAL